MRKEWGGRYWRNCATKLSVKGHLRDGIHQIVNLDLIRILLVLATRLFRTWQDIPVKIGELLGSYQEYPAKSVGKQGEELLIAVPVKS
jgi:hypothetical protein